MILMYNSMDGVLVVIADGLQYTNQELYITDILHYTALLGHVLLKCVKHDVSQTRKMFLQTETKRPQRLDAI